MSPDLTIPLILGMEFEQLAIAATVAAAAMMTIAMVFLVYASVAPNMSSGWLGEEHETGGSYEYVAPEADADEPEPTESEIEATADV